ISMGVRKGEDAFKSELEGILDRRRAAIRKILDEFGVPIVAAAETSKEGGHEDRADSTRGSRRRAYRADRRDGCAGADTRRGGARLHRRRWWGSHQRNESAPP